MYIFSYLGLFIHYTARYILPLANSILLIASALLWDSYLFVCFLVLLLINTVIYLAFNYKEETISPAETNMLSENDSDALLLISPDYIKKSSLKNDFNLQDWSAAWINTLEQEIGCFSVSDNSRGMKGKKAIIISSSFTEITPELIMKSAAEGAAIIMEKPSKEVLSHLGVKLVEEKKAGQITSGPLKGVPLNCKMDLVSFGGFDTILSIDNKPAIIAKRIGKGKIIIILFEYSKQIVSMQQGVPRSDYSVKHKNGLLGIIEPADLIYNKKFLDTKIPYADVLESLVVQLLDIPKFSKLPSGYSSGLIMTHDEDYCGEKYIKMIKEESDAGISPTFFATSLNSIATSNSEYFKDNEIELGIHWDKFPNEVFFRRKSSQDISIQKNLLKSQIISSRLHFLKWSPHYTNTFRLLMKNMIKIDSTYGINYGKGYGFGTSYFFHPIDTNGSIMPILELPFEVMEDRGNADARYVEDLIDENNSRYGGVLCFNFHPSLYEASKNTRSRIIELASRRNILMFSLRQFYDFHEKRSKSTIKTKGSTIKINAKANLDLWLPNQINKVVLDNHEARTKKIMGKSAISLTPGHHIVKIPASRK